MTNSRCVTRIHASLFLAADFSAGVRDLLSGVGRFRHLAAEADVGRCRLHHEVAAGAAPARVVGVWNGCG